METRHHARAPIAPTDPSGSSRQLDLRSGNGSKKKPRSACANRGFFLSLSESRRDSMVVVIDLTANLTAGEISRAGVRRTNTVIGMNVYVRQPSADCVE